MTTTDVSNLSDRTDCSVEIEVTGMSRHTLVKAGTSTIKVPFSSLSRTMQYIQRSGGKILKVTRLSGTSSFGSVPIATTTSSVEIKAVVVETHTPEPEPVAVETHAPEPEPVAVETHTPEPEPVAVETQTPKPTVGTKIEPKTTKPSKSTTSKRGSKKSKK